MRDARATAAKVVWGIFLVFAIVLAITVVLIILEANPENRLVEFIANFANTIDLGVFDLDNPIKDFGGENAIKKIALLNYGLAAVVYLIIGRILERVISPGAKKVKD